ncbi:unnamed protein product [Oppiella nova]|uniref:Mitochondrial dicarboxylate carrier n=1 Tax=Oppiella nova TaxID=334625 RepID=A0A7R9LDM7_9ACAR|nr:unnamed protein product [Oppiella nova]CAG2162587.1 unnamed protein product [Oppiella nova]
MTPAAQIGLVANTLLIVRSEGVLALYNGLTASLLRQLTYSTTRFGIYEVVKQRISPNGEQIPLLHKMLLAGVSGAVGGFIGRFDRIIISDECVEYLNEMLENFELMICCESGTPADMVNLSSYDQFKYLLMTSAPNIFEDNLLTHFTCSTLAGAMATTLTQPLDVLKTRLMNASANEYQSVGQCIGLLYKQSGLMGFFKGYVPAFIRLAPQTILTFVFLEQLRIRFGIRIISTKE